MHLIGYLDDLKEVTWQELESYQNLTGVEIPPGECRIIINLGMVQEGMEYKAKNKDCAAPFSADVSAQESESIVSSFTARFK